MTLSRNDAMQQLADAELVRLLVAGNHDAMSEIFDRYFRLVMSVALRVLQDTAEAEDVVQTVFTEFYQKARLFDESKGTLRTWLLQYAYGRTFNEKRKQKARHFCEPVELDELEAERCSDDSVRVLDLDKQDAARLVEQILPSLNEKQRLVIQMAFFEDMKLSEVASRTGESIGNIRHSYYRGMDKLRALLGEPAKRASHGARSEELQMSWVRKPRKSPQPLTGEVDIA
jgi:RNA polymerase sigma-70 factor (ECF subfamily)